MSRILSSRNPVTVGLAAKRLVLAGEWRTLPARDDQSKIGIALRDRLPFALQTLPAGALDALAAVGRELAGGACNWCAAAVIRAPEPELPHDDPVFTAILGKPCADCRVRWAASERAAELIAAGQVGDLTVNRFAWDREDVTVTSASARTAAAGRRKYYGSRPVGESWR